MRVLVFGGTGFLSGAVAAEAASRGHDVTCAARGNTGDAAPGTRLIHVDRNEPSGLEPLAGLDFDTVIDLALLSYRWVREALREIESPHWTFVSSVSVYADTFTPNQSIRTGRLRPPLADDRISYDPAHDQDPGQAVYGGVKLACEQAILEATAGHAFIVRPGLIVGPGDNVSPFSYWPVRMARGGRVAIPAESPAPELPAPAQYIDVRDLAAWLVDGMERRRTGIHDAAGPPTTLDSLLRGIADAIGSDSLELVPVSPEKLIAAGVRPWTGPKSMPLWPPRSLYGLMSRDVTDSLAAGLWVRPLADTAAATLRYELARKSPASPIAGLTPVEEAELLRLS